MTASHGGLGDRMVFRGTHIGSPASRSARENSPATTGWRFAQPRDAGFAALAASIVCVVVAVAAFVLSSPKFVVYQTPIGGREHVVLDDGGRITLNTNTRVRVRLTATERIAELERGEALFSVAHDPERPFEVTSRGVVARAVGTEFSVRAREDGLVETRVLEGAVAMSQPKRFLGVLYGRQAVRPLLHAGDRALIDDESARIERIGLKEIERGLLWRIGKIAFINETLAEAVAEFNRYTPRRLIIANPELAARRVGGQFETTDPDSFVQGLAETFGVRAVLTPEDEVRKGTDRLERVQ
ncbi:MAG: FecR domain-containing protein [Steroidobacteraceae bacterium]|nr:FecR domain-containing protein [Steroidobacteraceae bacterium]